MKPFVSIITITYNADKVLKKTIDSVWGQKNKNFEYIIIDGNSKDDTLNIIQQYENVRYDSLQAAKERTESDNSKIHWISEPDSGLYNAMNKGIEVAKGEFLWFINAGDKIYDDNTIENIISVWKNQPQADVIYGQSLIIDENDKPLGERHKIAPEKLTKKSLLNGLVVCHQSILVKKEIAPFYQLKYRITADYDWVCKVLESSTSNCYVPEYLSRFMVAGVSSQQRKKALLERYHIMKSHFGLWATLWAHCKIVIKYPFTVKY